ncbi:chloride channel protein [Hydrotalea sp.]|uniref:chloride channel protein n=1 Tax=Hydrotalea sp. TaxID=2881279 RepID=UPI0026028B33|nr:chloride channel protein [Hydrotalea sp.]
MQNKTSLNGGIPISVSLQPTLQSEDIVQETNADKRRILIISLLSILIAVCISFIAKFLIYLINLVTNISFYGHFSLSNTSPADNTMGMWIMLIPAIGGVIVGLMALYGSKAIRGHGIPEAMEQILTNQSKIKPTITYLKPISSAIAIGTGGPFGAEGPIIATGGALGSTLGQLFKITHNERKILLAAGATAGMSAIFNSPIAAIFLAIELLLFEFSPRSIIPVALACITGAAGHHLLFGAEPVFLIHQLIKVPSNGALLFYSIIGIIIGLLAVMVTKSIYIIEDLFEKLPIHWMWWPAIGGLVVGIVGYFAPHTLGVGYDNITHVLSGNMPIQLIATLCLFKFISWSIALSSGTSGGTLAPLLTIGGAAGALIGSLMLHFFPASGITFSLAALVGMSAMFAGASRALLTSIVFALETTGQSNALLPLLAACAAAYLLSFFLMENTIMTEKIARRGIKTPDSFEPDILTKVTVGEALNTPDLLLSEESEISDIREWLNDAKEYNQQYFIVIDRHNVLKGIISSATLNNHTINPTTTISTLPMQKATSVTPEKPLRAALEKMLAENIDVVAVADKENRMVGILSKENILAAYKKNIMNEKDEQKQISIKRNALKVLLKGKKLMELARKNSFVKINNTHHSD